MADGARTPDADAPAPRHDPEAERAVLAAVLLDNAVLATLAADLPAADFHDPGRALCWEAMLALRAQDAPIDVVTLARALRERGRLGAVGGTEWLGELTAWLPTTAHAERYAAIVRADAVVRRCARAAAAIAHRCADPATPAADVPALAVAAMSAAAQVRAKRTLVPLDEAVDAAMARIEAQAARGPGGAGVKTGLTDLDRLLNGLDPGQLVIVAGRPAMGKSALAVQVALHVARSSGAPALVFSLEMPRDELVNRMLCGEARVDQARLRANTLTGEDMAALGRAAQAIFGAPLLIDDAGGLRPAALGAVARDVRLRKGRLGLVVVDYLQLMQPDRASDSREREVGDVSRALKALAKELEVPVVALCQLNRDLERRPNKRPQLSDLRDSGALEQDADVVVFVYRDEVYHKDTEDRGIAELVVAKQRNGATGTARARFVREFTKFENLAEDPDAAPWSPPPAAGPSDDAPAPWDPYEGGFDG